MPVHIGTSGWQYRDWRERFYPRTLPQRDWLRHYAERFDTVEVNATFYRLPERATFESWARSAPAGFRMAVKMSRYLTHVRRLRDPGEPVRRLLDRAAPLGAGLGPVLVQLPATLRAEPGRLAELLDAFPAGVRVCLEPRHGSWFSAPVVDLLETRGAALCLADRGGRPITPLRRTAAWGYLRLHAGRAAPAPCYGRAALRAWAGRIAALWPDDADVYVLFNNDLHCCAVRDAVRFAAEVRAAGRRPGRTPDPAEVRLA